MIPAGKHPVIYDNSTYHNQSEGRTQVGSALERHTEGRERPAVQERARELAAASVSANTKRAYEGALRRLRDWLTGRELDDATLAEYLAARFEAGHSPAAANRCPPRFGFAVTRQDVCTAAVGWLTVEAQRYEASRTGEHDGPCRGVSRLLGSGGAPTDPAGQRRGRSATWPDCRATGWKPCGAAAPVSWHPRGRDDGSWLRYAGSQWTLMAAAGCGYHCGATLGALLDARKPMI